ncbi:sulfite reductase [NADPH] flavoprotein component [Microsporum ferrugineum]
MERQGETRLGAGRLELGFLAQLKAQAEGKAQLSQSGQSGRPQLKSHRLRAPLESLGCVRASLEQASLLSLPLVVHLQDGRGGEGGEDAGEAVELAGELGVPLVYGRGMAALAARLAPSMVLDTGLEAALDTGSEEAEAAEPERYRYYGPGDASAVVVVFGPVASWAVEAAASLRGKLGVVEVRVCPLEEEGLLGVMPASVQTVGVLGRARQGGPAEPAAESALFRQVLPLVRLGRGKRLACVDLKFSAHTQLEGVFRRFLGEDVMVDAVDVVEAKMEEVKVEEEEGEEEKTTRDEVVKGLLFKEAYGTQEALPRHASKTFTVTVKENRRLTPTTYDRNIFHLEFDLGRSGLVYEIGEALGVHPENPAGEVDEFARWYGLDQDELVSYTDGQQQQQRQTVHQALRRLDIFERPPKRFYQELSRFAEDAKEKERLATLATPSGAEEFKRRSEVEMLTYADLLQEFVSARPSFAQLARLVGPVKRREYSIASCQRVSPSTVALMVVVVGWVDGRGRRRQGQASTYLSGLKPGSPVTVSVKPSVMKLPADDPQTPLIMAGLGTGLAPFRAFVQHRALQKAEGKEIGPVLLYIGSRHQREEYCYGEEWEAYAAAGVITLLSCAFSRDQQHKVYIQDRMRQTMTDISHAYLSQQGSFYLCGPTWPVPDVTAVLEEAIALHARQADRKVDTRAEIERLKDQHRYVLEVY